MSAWLEQVFAAGSVAKGNIVRRKSSSVERYASVAELTAEVERQGFHLIETGDQLIIICNKGHVRLVL